MQWSAMGTDRMVSRGWPTSRWMRSSNGMSNADNRDVGGGHRFSLRGVFPSIQQRIRWVAPRPNETNPLVFRCRAN